MSPVPRPRRRIRSAALRLARRCALLLTIALAATALVGAGVPPPPDEDRREPGFCSPDCPLQQHVTHSVAVATDLSARAAPAERPRQAPPVLPQSIYPAVAVALDAPRAPPGI